MTASTSSVFFRPATDQPSMIVLRTVIAWPAPHAQGTGKAHGSALGADEVATQIRTWTAMVPVLASGEHCPHHFRARKPC